MSAASENAKIVAEYLRRHPKVARVDFLDFLPEQDSRRLLFMRQCKAAGSTFSFSIKGGERQAFAFLNALQHIKLAVSLGAQKR